jgi:uncharacterized protein YjiS (DUF1127 family)
MTHFSPSRDASRAEAATMLSCCTGWDDGRVSLPRPGGLARLVEALGARLRAARERRAETVHLAAMTDGELADMSISRPDVHRLFDPRFAHEYEQRRAGGRMRG